MSNPSSLLKRVRQSVAGSFRRKITIALLLVFLVISFVGVGLYVQIGIVLEKDIQQSMTAGTTAQADELTEWTSRHKLLTRALSDHPVYESKNDTQIRAYLRSQRVDLSSSEIVRAYVVDRRNETVVTSTDFELEGQDITRLSWYERFSFRSFNDVQMTDTFRIDNETTAIGFIAPIRRAPSSLLVVEINIASLFDRFQHPVAGGTTRVVNSNGTVVLADTSSEVLSQYVDEAQRTPIVSSGLRGEVGFTDDPTFDHRGNGSEYVAAYAPVPGTKWVVIEHAPANEAYAIKQRIASWIGAIAILGLVSTIGVVAVLGNDVETALSRLTRQASQIESGNYDVEFDTERRDEFGDLASTLAAMRDTLNQRINELNDAKSDLRASNMALEERSAMVGVLHRVLRHNVRNDLNIIAGRAGLAAAKVKNESVKEDLEVIEQVAWQLAELSNRTQRLKQLLSQTEPVSLDLEKELRSNLPDCEESEDEVTVELELSERPLHVKAPPVFPEALADVVARIFDHNDEAVHVEITASVDDPADDCLEIVIQDDQNGLPASDLNVINSGEETPLKHAEGLELWSLEWTVSKAGGSLDPAPEDGTLQVRLPRSNPN